MRDGGTLELIAADDLNQELGEVYLITLVVVPFGLSDSNKHRVLEYFVHLGRVYLKAYSIHCEGNH